MESANNNIKTTLRVQTTTKMYLYVEYKKMYLYVEYKQQNTSNIWVQRTTTTN